MATRLSTSPHNDSSRTITITDAASAASTRLEDVTSTVPDRGTIGTLRLRAGTRHQQQVAWDEDVVDNEGCGRKSSKICCIYHKPRKFDESSSEESSSESESDSDAEHQRWRQARHAHQRDHDHHPCHHHQHDGERREGPAPQMRPDQATPGGVVHQLEQDGDRNAYEIMPSPKKGKRKAAS